MQDETMKKIRNTAIGLLVIALILLAVHFMYMGWPAFQAHGYPYTSLSFTYGVLAGGSVRLLRLIRKLNIELAQAEDMRADA